MLVSVAAGSCATAVPGVVDRSGDWPGLRWCADGQAREDEQAFKKLHGWVGVG